MAIFRLRRGTSASPALVDGELFLNYTSGTIQFASGSSAIVSNLLPLGKSVTGDIQLTGDITASNITLSGDLAARNVNLSGNIYLGDGSGTDEIIVNAELSGSLIPDTNNEYDLGSTTRKYKNIFAVSASIDDITLNGSNIVSSSQQISNYNTFLEINSDSVVSGSSQINHDSTTGFVGNEHINHSSVSITAGNGLTGGGNITTSRTLNIVSANNGIVINSDDIELDTDSTTFTSGVKTKLNLDGVFSSSAQIEGNFLEINGDSVVSSSQQISNYNTFLEIDGMGVFSGSSQVNANSITNFDTNVKDKMNDDGVISGSSQLTTEFDTRYLNTNGDSVVSGSSQIDVTATTNYSSINQYSNTKVLNYVNDLGLFSGSEQVNADSITNFDSNVKDKLNLDGVISGSSQLDSIFLEINGDSVVSQSLLNDLTNSEVNQLKNIDSTTISTTQWGYLGNTDQGISTTDNVTFNTGSFTGNVTVTGNLSVLGSATEIQTSELRIEDKLITVASGSADSAASDGAGLEIDGANKSLTWDHNSTSFVFDAKVSSSVGFKGEGGELTGIDTDQVTEAGNLYYTNTRVLDYINDQGVHSGSFLGTATTSNLTEGTNLYYTDARVLSYIHDQGVISGSSQISLDGFDTDDLSEGVTNQYYTNTRVTNQVNDLGVFSGSSQIDHDATTNFVANEHIDHSSITVGSGKGLSGGGTIDTSRSITLDTGSTHFSDGVVEVLPNGTISGSSQVNADSIINFDSNVVDVINDENVHSGSFLGTATTTNLSEGTNLYYTDTRVLQYIQGQGVISGSTFSSPSQGTVRANINGTQTDVDTGLQTGDSPTFTGLSLSGVSELGAAEVSALVSGSAGSVGYRVLGTAAFLNVSNSIDNDQNVIPTNFAVNQALIAAGAGDITSVNPSSTYGNGETTGLLHTTQGTNIGGVYGTQGDIVIAIATGSSHFTDGVTSALPNGLVSGSSQLDSVFLEINGDGVVSSSLQVNSLFAGTAVSTSLDSRIVSLETDSHTHSNKSNLDSINQDLANNDNVQFADLVLTGDLTVQGTTTTLNTQELTIEDKLLSVASGSTTTAAADGGGFHISGANASITWDNGNSRLAVNKSTHFTGDVQATGDIVAYASSDIQLKNDIEPISNPLEKINKISGNSFVWNEEKQNIYKGKDYGVIAQEIEEILPELVQTREDGYKAVKYDKIVSLLIEGIKELSKEVTQLKENIKESN
jgi:hypothetical protein